MKAATLLLFIVPSACSDSRTAPTPAALKEATHDDTIPPELEKWRARTEASETAAGDCKALFTAWSEIDSAPLRRLFPAHRFFSTGWDQTPVDSANLATRSFALGLGVTLAVARDTHSTAELYHWGNYEAFGDFLRSEGIRVPDDAAARLVWDAFCDMHLKRWTEQGIERVNATLWHLGIADIDRRRYYYELILGADGLVQSGRLCSVGI